MTKPTYEIFFVKLRKNKSKSFYVVLEERRYFVKVLSLKFITEIFCT